MIPSQFLASKTVWCGAAKGILSKTILGVCEIFAKNRCQLEKKFNISYSASVRFLAIVQWFFFLAGLAVVSWSVAHVLS